MTALRGAPALVLAVLVGLTGCSSEASSAPETTPAGALVLEENAPADVAGSSVVATTFEDSGATLRISEDGSPSTPTEVSVGHEIRVADEEYRVEAIWSEGDSGEPGGQGGRVMLVPLP